MGNVHTLKYSLIMAVPRIFLALLSGAILALGFPFKGDTSIFLAPFIAFFLFNYLLSLTTSFRAKFLYSILFSIGFYQTGYYWIPHLLFEFGGLAFPTNYLLGLVFSIIVIPQVYIYVFFQHKTKNIFLLSSIYPLIEYYLPQQFPAHLGHTFISLAPKINLNLAPYFGVPIYSFIVVLSSLSVLQHLQAKKMPTIKYVAIFVLIILSSIPISSPSPKIKELKLRIVQANIGNFLKVDSERGGEPSIKKVYESYFHFSTKEPRANIDLIIWPETAFPTLINSEKIKLGENTLPPIFKDISEYTNAELFFGGYDYSQDSDFNAAFLLNKTGNLKDIYHKIKLIPFGEGLPFGPLNPYLKKYAQGVSFFTSGTVFTQFKLEDGSLFQSAICYEILFPEFIRDLLNSPKNQSQFIINLTNDSWYGETQEPYQHLFLTKWRALEFQMPIVRSTNTGITTIIYPDGSESERLMIYEKKNLEVALDLFKTTPSHYQKYGIFSFLLLCLFIIGLEKIPLLKGRVSE